MKTSQHPAGEVLFLAILLLGMGALITIGVLEMCAQVARPRTMEKRDARLK